MELQRILAKDSRAAMDKVLELYGQDALVVSNKKANEKTEIIVAIEVPLETEKTLNEMQVAPVDLPEFDFSDSVDFDQVMESHVFKTTPVADDKFYTPARDLSLEAERPPAAVSNSITNDRDHLQAREIVDLVKQEFEVMRREFKLSQQLDAWNGTRSVTEPMRPLVEAFNETGMPIGLRALLSDTINGCSDLDSALREIAQILGNGIDHLPLLEDMQGIHLIAGSSGSGKSLMTGRLAKQKALRCDSQDVAIISYNDNRFGAWNQTQLIGSQAGVDCFRANTPEMLEQLLQELGSRSLILIDTAGVDVQGQIKELNKLLPEAQKHLVVAADASEASVNRQLKAGSGDWDSIMLSRLEDDIRPWPVINALLNTRIPISVSASEPSIAAAPVALTGLELADHSLTNLPVA
jgi:flagellar biosynthesis GTPase FlhF